MQKNLISIENLNKAFLDKPICNDASFGVHEGDKIALIGINGCGKSTLLKMLVNQEEPDSGRITFRNQIRVGYLPQIPILDGRLTIFQQIYQSDHPEFVLLRQYHQLNDALAQNSTAELQHQQQQLIKQIESAGAWEMEIKAKSILTQLGFDDFQEKVNILSGGQKRRLDLARVLMDSPDILILDEPTNHLDIDTIEWLQDYLANYPGTLLFVTHDRYFLDTVSNKIMEIEDGQIRFYEGNYSYYLEKKEMEQIDRERKETRRLAQLKKELKWLRRGARARTSKPKSHIEKVQELLDKSYLTNEQEMEIALPSKRLGKTILEVQGVGKRFDRKPLFENFQHTFQKLERVGIIGANGCGKTTLLRMITGENEPTSGHIKVGMNTHFAYFRQEAHQFDPNQTVLDYIREEANKIRTEDGNAHSAAEMLERFLFDRRMQQQKIGSLSGGEKKRLYLLKSLMFGSNFIILDEPTNDLDIRTLEILEDYLDVFKGCLLVVSHDRFFLDRVVDYLFVFEKGQIRKFPGNYSDYLLVKRFQDEEIREVEKQQQKEKRQAAAKNQPKKLSYKEARELETIEAQIMDLESQKEALQQQMENPDDATDYAAFQQMAEQMQAWETELETLMNRWEELETKRLELEV